MAEEKKPESLITLDFCHWLFNNFDDLVAEYNEFGRVLTVKDYIKYKSTEDLF